MAGRPVTWRVEGLILDRETGQAPADSTLVLYCDTLRVIPGADGRFEFNLLRAGTYGLILDSRVYKRERKVMQADAAKPHIFISFSLTRRVRQKAAPVPVVRDSVTGAVWELDGFMVDEKTELAIDPAGLSVKFDGQAVPVDEKGGLP